MGWTVPTYFNTYMGGDPSNARLALFELMRAVNERETYLRLPNTEFVRSDETEGANLALEEIAWIPAATKDNSPGQQNLKRIRDAILDMVPTVDGGGNGFILPDAHGTGITRAWLESEIGFDLSEEIVHPQSAAYWQAIQDAMDLLTHIRLSRGDIRGGGSATRETYYATNANAQAAWDAMLADTPSVASWPSFYPTAPLEVYKTHYFGYAITANRAYTNLVMTTPTSGAYDDVASVYVDAGAVYVSGGPGSGIDEIDVRLDGTTYTVEWGTSGVLLMATSQVPLDAGRTDVDFDFDSLPSATPFPEPDPEVEGFGVQVSKVLCHFDLTSLLSDQT